MSDLQSVDPVHPAFKVHVLNKSGLAAIAKVADDFNALLRSIEDNALPGRELAIVATKLEEACFFAKKAVASHPGHQQ